ncbi:hypothetical protein NBE99_03730 [Thermosynechococcus sp. HN-54]|uniref:hypothetical protein n=1 Tax=Thermosynechococcus sp. HN-54 TaxID=2933959 RepID=UPI00202D0B17|nr:hypothetical protein [Thermosynechococcus sp. HN-54]URR36254.1 hypothetical protein NBE99_03730 [Thermosynechococcus sp. HN-54]
MHAHKLTATLIEDGTLVLKGLPFHTGDTVEVIILEQPKENPLTRPEQVSPPPQGTVLRYNEPLETAAGNDYLDAVAATLIEWNSEADDLAYSHL